MDEQVVYTKFIEKDYCAQKSRNQKSSGLNTGFAIEWNPEHKYRTQV